MEVPEFDKHLKKARGHIGRNVVEIIKMKTIVRKPLMIKNYHALSQKFKQPKEASFINNVTPIIYGNKSKSHIDNTELLINSSGANFKK